MRFTFITLFFSCLAGLSLGQEGSGLTKLLVTAGYDGTDLNHAEVVDLLNEDAECGLPQVYPQNVFGVVGALLNGKTPMVCGGYHCCGSDYKDTCHILKGNEWVPTANMAEKRLWSAATQYPVKSGDGFKMGFFMTGGNHLDVHALDSTEIFEPSEAEEEIGSWKAGPALPVPLEEHCLVTIDTNTIFLIGGNQPYATRVNTTFFLDIAAQKWTPGPQLQMNRDGLGCGLLKDGSSGKTYVVAAGGFNGLVHLESVELMDLDQPDTWFAGPALPAALHNGRIVQDTSGATIFIGGQRGDNYRFSDKLYKLEAIDGQWTEMKASLKVGRNNHAAFLVPDEAVTCK